MQAQSRGTLHLILSLIICSAQGACQHGGEAPKLASSADTPAYAIRYSADIGDRQTQLSSLMASTSVTLGLLKDFPDELQDPDWGVVASIYQQAEKDGKGAAFGQRWAETVTVGRFFEEEKKPLVGRTAAAAQHAAKKEGHDLKLYGAVAFGLDKAVEKQLQARTQKDSAAFSTIQEQEARLGKKNIDKLKEQTNRIMLASYVAHFGLETAHAELATLHAEAGQAQETLEAELERARSTEKPDKGRIEALETALKELTAGAAGTTATLEEAESRKETLRKEFETEFETLVNRVKEKHQLAAGGS